jgi:hypothetical protein
VAAEHAIAMEKHRIAKIATARATLEEDEELDRFMISCTCVAKELCNCLCLWNNLSNLYAYL